ncbi:hypothetical protein AGATL06_05520 [Agathobaculum sp. TL06]
MYWICFGDSAKGCLSVARHRIAPDMPKEKIIALLDDYTQGDIRDAGNRAAREDILFPWREEESADHAWMQDYLDRHWEAFGRLDEVDEAVVWAAGGNAVEQCGLRYVVSRLYERRVPVWLAEVDEIPLGEIEEEDEWVGGAVSVVTSSRVLNFFLRFAPQPLVRRYAARVSRRGGSERAKDGRVRYSLVGEMEQGAARYFYRRRRLLTETEQGLLLTEWKRMQEENAPLRVMEAGRPRSAAIDFYDQAILACVPEKEGTAAQTVGGALLKIDQELGNRVGDMLVFSRIRALGAAGRLEIVRDAPSYRDMTIRKIRS